MDRKHKFLYFFILIIFALIVLNGCGGAEESGKNDTGTEYTTESKSERITEYGTEQGYSTEPEGITEPEQKAADIIITALSVGKADAILIETGDVVCLIDTGEKEDGAYILQALRQKRITGLDLLLITHYDKDHVGSAAEIANSIPVTTIMLPDYVGERAEYLAFMEAIQDHKDVRVIREITDYQNGNLNMRVYPAENAADYINTEDEYDNDLSLVSMVTYGEKRFLFTGDIEKKRIRQMLEAELNLDCDWIKLPHHGKYQKAVKELLEVCTPEYAVLTVSQEEYAEEKTLEYLEEQGIEIYDTVNEDVITYSDGNSIWIEGSYLE